MSRLTSLPLRWLGAGLGVLALGVSGFFHGLDSAADTGPPQLKPDTVSEDGPWKVTVLTCRVVSSLPPLVPQTAGDRWFIVLANVEVTADQSQNGIGQIIGLPDVFGLVDKAPDEVLLARDGSAVQYLNPGMTERIGFVWEQLSTVPVPKQALVQVFGKTLRENSLTGNKEWLDLKVRAEVRAPVQDRRA